MDRAARTDGGSVADRSIAGALALMLVAIVLVAAAVIVVARTVSTSSARVAATTSTGGLLSAGTIVLGRAGDVGTLLLDADQLYPGRVAHGCVEVRYDGTVPVEVRVGGDRQGGTGLERYVDVELVALDEPTCPADLEAASGRSVFAGRLATLLAEGTEGSADRFVAAMSTGDRVAIVAVATVVDDDDAQGRSTEFAITFEGRAS